MRKTLIVIQLFIAITSFMGGYGLVSSNGLGMPLSWLQTSPFSSFVVPGLLLALIIGGSHALAAYWLAKNKPWALPASAVAAFAMLIWIFGQLYFVLHSTWLQTFYFTLGIVELILVLLLLRLIPTDFLTITLGSNKEKA